MKNLAGTIRPPGHGVYPRALISTASCRGRDVNQQGDNDPDNWNQIPLAGEPMLYDGIPEERRRQKDETKDRPEDGMEEPLEPIGEEPKKHDDQAWCKKREDGHQAWHVAYLPVGAA